MGVTFSLRTRDSYAAAKKAIGYWTLRASKFQSNDKYLVNITATANMMDISKSYVFVVHLLQSYRCINKTRTLVTSVTKIFFVPGINDNYRKLI